MKPNHPHPALPSWFRTAPSARSAKCLRRAISGVAAAIGLVLILPAAAQTDDFNSGSLTGWATSVSSNYPASLTFVPDGFGGQALRMSAITSSLTNDAVTNMYPLMDTSRVFIWMTNQYYTNNFYVAVDLLNWNSSPDRTTNDAVIGLVAHLTNVVRQASVPIGRPDAVIFATRYQANGGNNEDNGTRGQLQFYGITDGQAGQPFSAAAQGDFTIEPGHQYRLVFTGTNQWDEFGNSTNFFYCGRVYDLLDLTRPLATLIAWEPYYPAFHNIPAAIASGNWSPEGYSGVFAIGYNTTAGTNWTPKACDITIDNFVAAEHPPATGVNFPATAHGETGAPQVVNRIPASYANFYDPAGGISFTATTLGGDNVTEVKLYLNGVDVSSSLSLGPLSNNRTVTYPASGLASNAYYEARVELASASGKRTTNLWTFDTFSDAYLASAACKNIECEDFDFANSFIDNPVVSGYIFGTGLNPNIPTNTTMYLDLSLTPYPWPGVINQGPTSYVLKGGFNAKTNGGTGDYYDYDTTRNRSQTTYEGHFRPLGSIGTQQGCADYLYFLPGWGQFPWYTPDTQRQKYASVDPDLQEYCVERTEGGEWMNYTRTFDGASYYNVYLRHGCELSQQLSLDAIAGGTMKHLGTFYVTNALAKSNFRYVPLMKRMVPPGNLIVNGDFAANAFSFISFPGYVGGSNPSSITGWTTSGVGNCGINGAGTSFGSYPFSPVNPIGAVTYAFIQNTGGALIQPLTTLAPNTTYQLVYSVAGRSGNTASYRVVVYADNTYTTSYYDSGVQPANSSGFVTVTASFTTPASLGSAPNIQLMNSSVAGDNTVDFANVVLAPGSSPLPTASQPAVVNLSGVNTLRLTVAVPQKEKYKQALLLNYMAFVPALVVESSAQAGTGYTYDPTAVVEPITKTITIPQNGNARFYRLRWDRPTNIQSVSAVGGNVVLTYQ